MYKIGVVGLGFVGSAVSTGMEMMLGEKVEIREHDKFKNSEALDDVVDNSDIIFVCVPTPMHSDGECDTSIVEEVCASIDKIATVPKAIIIKSTVPPGTTQAISDSMSGGHGLVFNPEFLTEAKFMEDFLNQDRVLLGFAKQCSSQSKQIVKDLYGEFSKKQKVPALIKSYDVAAVAEMTKYMTNCFLATKLSFCNEMFEICDEADIEYNDVVEAWLLDKRIGSSHTSVPGADGQKGFSLSCLPKDLNAMIAYAEEKNLDPVVLNSVWMKNLLVRDDHDWNELPQVNGRYKKEI